MLNLCNRDVWLDGLKTWKKFLALLSGVALAGMTTLAGAPALAAPTAQKSEANQDASKGALEPTTMVAFGEQTVGQSGSVAQADLKKAVAAQDGASIQFAVPARAALSYDVYSSWKDNKAKTTAIRWGTATWGWRHVQKHNVSLKMIQKTTKYPKDRYSESGNRLIYRTPANKYKCWLGICKTEKTMMVFVLVNNSRLAEGKHRGVITSYCEGLKVCPNWVREVA